MNVICPRCCSAKIVKNGATHYGKQNHRCKECNRQFVLNNKHTIRAEIRKLISKSLLERNSLRAICRIFDISLTWLQAFAQSLWSQVPKRLGLTKKMIKKVKKMQVFGLQADEMWSFVGKKACKRWIWIVFDPIYRVVVAYHIGDRSDASAKALYEKIPKKLRSCRFETDDWDSYKKIFETDKHRIGKAYTYFIEGFNATVRARCSRLVRKALSFSKSDKWHNLAIGYLFWQLNLDRHPYF
jgi:IS1 family transposase